MTFAMIDGIKTRYEILGDGPALLMYAPGGFDARIEKWSDLGVYAKVKYLEHLPKHFKCILFDRRENGQSGGRLERITWADYVAQGAGLLDHLEIEKAHIMGGCMGCSPVSAFGVTYPKRTRSMVQFWPVGGPSYRISSHQRFARHLSFVEENGLQAVVDLVATHDKNFSADPRGGPWGQSIRNSTEFAATYAAYDTASYLRMVTSMYRGLFDRDTSPGAEPEDLMNLKIPSLIIPGSDGFHSTSAARYMQECLLGSDYWDIAASDQTQDNTPAKVIAFLQAVDAA